MPGTYLERAKEYDPISFSDETAKEIVESNEAVSKRAESLLAQLRSGNMKNVEEAAVLHDFYMYSLSVMECNAMTFPSMKVANKLSKLYPHLPRSFRQTVTMRDLTEAEMERAMKRIAKRFDLHDDPFLPQKRKRSLRL